MSMSWKGVRSTLCTIKNITQAGGGGGGGGGGAPPPGRSARFADLAQRADNGRSRANFFAAIEPKGTSFGTLSMMATPKNQDFVSNAC
jgi:hypothetical protein